jgi:hypothetical protein
VCIIGPEGQPDVTLDFIITIIIILKTIRRIQPPEGNKGRRRRWGEMTNIPLELTNASAALKRSKKRFPESNFSIDKVVVCGICGGFVDDTTFSLSTSVF